MIRLPQLLNASRCRSSTAVATKQAVWPKRLEWSRLYLKGA